MKLFEMPAIEVMKFAVEDVLTVSETPEATTDPFENFYPYPCMS